MDGEAFCSIDIGLERFEPMEIGTVQIRLLAWPAGSIRHDHHKAPPVFVAPPYICVTPIIVCEQQIDTIITGYVVAYLSDQLSYVNNRFNKT